MSKSKYSIIILNALLERYEDSSWFRTGTGTRRVFLPEKEMRLLSEQMENPDEKAEIIRALTQLSEQGLVSFSWEKYEEGNLLSKIWLNTESDAVRESCQIAGRKDKKEVLAVLMEQLEKAGRQLSVTKCGEAAEPASAGERSAGATQGTIGSAGALLAGETQGAVDAPGSEIRDFIASQAEWIREKKRLPRFFTGIVLEDKELISCLVFLVKHLAEGKEITERVLSSRLYGDSKHFEREIRSRLISCLRAIWAQGSQNEGARFREGERQQAKARWPQEEELLRLTDKRFRDEELLQMYGIVRWPEVMEFTGDISVILEDNSEISFSASRYGAYINTDTIDHICCVRFGPIKRVLFIENKANYIWYVQTKRQPDELVLYHGGFYSPAKGYWFRLLYETGKRLDDITWHHWSDIDLGGFLLFLRLKNNLIPELLPYCMDLSTLKTANIQGKCMPVDHDSYRKKLQRLLEDPASSIFHETIRYMLAKNVRLEQEQLISDSE